MKTLRWLALVCSLLIIGLFIAPGPSEAVGPPTLTVNGDPVVFQPTTGTGTTTPGTCSLSDHNAGYTACYQIDTTRTYGGWSVMSISSTNLGMRDAGMIGGQGSAVVSVSLAQTQPYQSNSCNTNTVLNQCSPTIMQTLMFVEFNGDTLFLTNSSDGAGGDCVVTPPAVPPSPPFGLPPGPVSPCKAREGKIKSFFNGADSADNRAANQAGASPSTPCETEVCFPPGGGG